MDRSHLRRRPGARRAARILFLAAAYVLLATVTRPGPVAEPAGPAVTALTAAPVALDRHDPERRRVGGLVFLGGWALTSPDRRFGGISALHVAGGRATAVSDAGTLFRFAVPPGEGAGTVRIDPLPAGPGPLGRKSNRDSEAMLIEDTTAWIGFEVHNMVWRYALPGWRSAAAARPRAMASWGRTSAS